jgi:hypothetical protein
MVCTCDIGMEVNVNAWTECVAYVGVYEPEPMDIDEEGGDQGSDNGAWRAFVSTCLACGPAEAIHAVLSLAIGVHKADCLMRAARYARLSDHNNDIVNALTDARSDFDAVLQAAGQTESGVRHRWLLAWCISARVEHASQSMTKPQLAYALRHRVKSLSSLSKQYT